MEIKEKIIKKLQSLQISFCCNVDDFQEMDDKINAEKEQEKVDLIDSIITIIREVE